MVKKLKLMLQSSWIRRSSMLMGCVLVLISCVSPASGYVINNDYNQTTLTALTGTAYIDYSVPSGYDDVSNNITSSYPIGGLLPYVPLSQDYENVLTENAFLLGVVNDLDVSTSIRYARLSGRSFGSYPAPSGLDMSSFLLTPRIESGYPSVERIRFVFDPYYLRDGSYDFLYSLLTIESSGNFHLEISVHYSYFNSDRKQLINTSFSDNADLGAGRWLPLHSLSERLFYYVSDQDLSYYKNIFLESIIVEITPLDDNFTVPKIQLLSETSEFHQNIRFYDPYSWATPSWHWDIYMYRCIEGIYADQPDNPGSPSYPDFDNPSSFTKWLASSVSGFFEFEIFPNFSFGGILTSLVAVIIAILILKFFAGG